MLNVSVFVNACVYIGISQIKCTLNDHEFPCDLDELQHFTSGKKYKKLSAEVEFDYRQYEPHIVNSTKQP